MTKKLMSVVALATILGTGAQAFDTNLDGDILTRDGLAGNYGDPLSSTYVAVNDLVRSTDDIDRLKGDALIYPAFDMKDGWGTEITVRNNLGDTAVIAKVVVYAADDSRELVDFNIYLSQNDQFKMVMKDGTITSSDGSVAIEENFSNDTVKFASVDDKFSINVVDPITKQRVDEGYVIIFGMAQTETGFGTATDKGYHEKHTELFGKYREQLNTRRTNWHRNAMHLGVYNDANATQTPNISADGNLTSVHMAALSGTERMFNESGEIRDLLLNPTALENFTDIDQLVLWAPGEYATLADRDINATGFYPSATNGLTQQVLADSQTFLVNSTTYTYNNAEGNVDNRFIITQPTKRLLVQLGYGTNYWIKSCEDTSDHDVVTGLEWGFRGDLTIYNEDELDYTSAIGGGIITSPLSSSTLSAHCNELTTLTNLEEPAEDFALNNGFVNFNLTTGSKAGVPAIVTQMAATRVGTNDENGRVNWIYAPATKTPLAP